MLRRMLGKAEEWNVIKASPKIKLMQEHARERVIDADAEAKLLPFCKQPLRDVLMIMRDSGMRNQKEVFRMRWEHLDWANNCARHGFGTEMYRATKNLFAVMNVMGHTTVSTTMKYQHQNIDEVVAVTSRRV